MNELKFNPKELRKEFFYKKNFDLDPGLTAYVSKILSNSDLYIPLVHYIQIYLFEYMHEFINRWFGNSNVKVLDWGCGLGYYSYLFGKRGIDVTACDISEVIAGNRPFIESLGIPCAALPHPYELPFKANTFDVILNCGVLEHVPNDVESLKEIYRVLKPNGLFFTYYLPAKYSWRQNIAGIIGAYKHENLYKNRQLTKLIQNCGLKIIDRWVRDVVPFRRYSENFRLMEKIDYLFCRTPPFKWIASNIEFVAYKEKEAGASVIL